LLPYIPRGTFPRKIAVFAGFGGQSSHSPCQKVRNNPHASPTTSIQSVHACSPNGGEIPPSPPKRRKKVRNGGGTPLPPKSSARFLCLQESRGRRSTMISKNSDGSDGMNRVAPSLPTQDLRLIRRKLAQKHRRYGRYRRWRGRFTVDTVDKFEHEELKMRTEKVLTKSAEGLLYQRYHARIEVDTLGRKLYEMQKSQSVPLSPLVP
jgi:hypothetical protein